MIVPSGDGREDKVTETYVVRFLNLTEHPLNITLRLEIGAMVITVREEE